MFKTPQNNIVWVERFDRENPDYPGSIGWYVESEIVTKWISETTFEYAQTLAPLYPTSEISRLTF
jgi:hypothetical protein